MPCASCGFENPEGMKFCEECGTKLVQACPSCGREVRPTAKFCGECGTLLTGQAAASPSVPQDVPPAPSSLPTAHLVERAVPEAERRQLTVLFCDLVGSTALSEQLDPEDLREVVRTYQESCTGVIGRYEGHIAQHLGDGLLVYFGYPVAHEDDAQQAVRTALEIVEAMQQLSLPTIALPRPLQVRIGIHTGLVVVGEIGSSAKREILALGETPNLAARLQGIAEPDTVVISAATQRLVQGLFAGQALGPQTLKGLTTPVTVYQVLGESAAHSRFEAAVQKGLTPLVGRAHEVGLLEERWEQAKAGEGQVVLLSGEPGIGKSRLVQTLKEQVGAEGATRLEFRCSPHSQNSALYPIIDYLQRVLQFTREDTPAAKVEKLRDMLSHYRFPQADTVPLLAALLSLPHPEGSPPITVSPQKQKEKTHAALVAWLVEAAEKAAVFCAWEDLHWADPSTLEVLTLLLAQVPTTRLLAVLTYRPEFTPPWGSYSYLSQLTLSRLGRSHVEMMVEKVIGGHTLPQEIVRQIVSKTDGVPLFVEELTKSVLESVGAYGRAPQSLAIPATLHDSLMARLDRLGPTKEIAQVGATIGREFTYEVLQALSPLNAETLQQGLRQLVAAELVYQSGAPPQVRYLFKHALIQDTAYQSLLKSRRQQYHQQIAQVLEERFPETREAHPELVAHHYTEAGLIAQAISYWQRAGQRAIQRSANVEAIAHLKKGLELLKTLSDTPERAQQELTLQIILGTPLMATEGFAAPEVGKAYTRAQELCRQVGETPQLFPVLQGLWAFYLMRAELQTALALGDQLFTLAQNVQDPMLLLQAHYVLGINLFSFGEVVPARAHLEQSLALYDPQKNRSYDFRTIMSRVIGLDTGALALWLLGYPDQALERGHEALTLAQELAHPQSLAIALINGGWLHHYRREGQAAQARAEAAIALSTEQGFAQLLAVGTIQHGWALTEQGQGEEGIVQLRQGLAACWATGAELYRSGHLALLAEAHAKAGQVKEGLSVVAEALAFVDKTGERYYEAELYRLRGELTLAQSSVQGLGSSVQTSLASRVQRLEAEAEEYFLKAIEVARKQQAKSLELRAVMSLSRLWQQQGKKEEARQMLAEIYGWFTEGFDTKDLQEAQALLDALSSES